MDSSYKVMVLGAQAVGKTSIARRLKFNAFDAEHKATIGVELYSVPVSTDVGETTVVLWDTDGGFGETIFENVFVKGADAAIVVADVTREETIDRMVALSQQFSREFPGTPVSCLLNKTDIHPCTDEQLVELDKSCPRWKQCSAKSGDGLLDAIKETVLLLAR